MQIEPFKGFRVAAEILPVQFFVCQKLAKSTLVREKQDIERFKPYLSSCKLVDLRPEHFCSLYAKLRKQKNKSNGKPLSEATVEGVHSLSIPREIEHLDRSN